MTTGVLTLDCIAGVGLSSGALDDSVVVVDCELDPLPHPINRAQAPIQNALRISRCFMISSLLSQDAREFRAPSIYPRGTLAKQRAAAKHAALPPSGESLVKKSGTFASADPPI
jgi:hypothetical protein